MGKRTITINPDMIWIILLGTATFMAAVALSRHSPFMIALIPLALIVASIILANDEFCMATAILVLPLFASILLSAYFLPVTGAKINNILYILLLIGFILNCKINLRNVKLGAFFYIGSLLFLIIAVIRTDHVASYAVNIWYESYQPFKFFLSHGLIPIMVSIPFLMIIGKVRTMEEINRVIFYIALSLSLFSAIIIYIYIFMVPLGSDFSTARNIIGLEYLGMHGNNMADFIIVGFPLIFAMALVPGGRYQKWYYLASLLLLVAATLTYSRSAYITILFSIPAILFLTGKFRSMLPLLVLLVLLIIIVPGVIERAITGLEEGGHDVITAGRTDYIWRPVLKEWSERVYTDPLKVVFGHGRYGIMDFQAFKNQRMIQTTHPHNMYLDTLVNIGLVGLLFYLIIISYVIVKISQALLRRKKQGSNYEIHIVVGLLMAIICFLIRGMSDSFLSLQLTNSYFYIIMAIAFVVLWQEQVAEHLRGGK